VFCFLPEHPGVDKDGLVEHEALNENIITHSSSPSGRTHQQWFNGMHERHPEDGDGTNGRLSTAFDPQATHVSAHARSDPRPVQDAERELRDACVAGPSAVAGNLSEEACPGVGKPPTGHVMRMWETYPEAAGSD
jgi:biotin carboxylase